MEAKLIKKSENYYELYEVRTNLTLLIGSTDSEKKIDVYGKDAHKLLSLKNCQAIENGYDLDELAEEGVKFHEQDEIHRPNSENLYKKGFQKALELMEHRLSKETEWQVEIVMDICGDKVYAVPEPALDEQGCLILKRIDN